MVGNNDTTPNNDSLLEIIASCVDGSNVGASRVMNVSISGFSKSDLSEVITNGFSIQQNKSNKDSEKRTDRIIDILNDNSKREIEASKELLRDLKKLNYSSVFDKLGDMLSGLLEWIPIVGGIISDASKLAFAYAKVQMENINDYRQLNASGVLYREDLKKLWENAELIGVSKDELKNALIKNSQVIAKLNGTTGNGIGAFRTLFEQVKKTSNSIGMDLNDSVSVISIVANNIYSDMEYNSRNLNESTEKYMKTLKTLSYWTGKSTESLINEQKKREEDAIYKTWASNSGTRAAELAGIADIVGTDEFKKDLAFGMNRGSISKAAAINPYLAETYEKMMYLRQNMDRISDEEFESFKKEIMFEIQTKKMSEYAKKIPTAIVGSYGEDLQQVQLTALRVSQLSTEQLQKAIDTVKNPDSFIEGINDADSKIQSAIDRFFKLMSLQSEDVEKRIVEPMVNAAKSFDEFAKSDDKTQYIVDALKKFFIYEHPLMGLIFGAGLTMTVGKLLYNMYLLALQIAKFFGVPIKLPKTGNPVKTPRMGLINSEGQKQFKNFLKEHPDYKTLPKEQQLAKFLEANPMYKNGKYLKYMKGPGRVGGIITFAGYGIEGYEGWNDYQEAKKRNDERGMDKAAIGTATSMAVGLGTTYAGGQIGAALGTAVAPGPGTVIGGAIGMILGGVASIFTSDKAKEFVNDQIDKHYDDLESQESNENYLDYQSNQTEKMKIRDDLIEEERIKVEELKKQLEDAQSENKKNALECLRSIDTKLDILMNLDGKYNKLLESANIIRNIQEWKDSEMDKQS